VLYLPFSEGSGTTAHDVSGYENHGTITGASWNESGKIGYALSFNETNNYIVIPDSSSLDSIVNAVTIAVWVKPTAIGSGMWLVSKGGAYNRDGFATLITSSGGFRFTIGTGTSSETTIENGVLSSGVWYHLAAVFDGATMKAYINGVLQPTTATPASYQLVTNYVVRVGYADVSGLQFNGTIDEACFYNRVLTPQEIATLAGIGYTPEAPALTTVNVQWTWQYLYAGDFIGFGNALLLTAFLSQTLALAVISLIGFSALYLRTKSLMLLAILWILLGGFFIAAMPEVALLAIAFLALGIGSLFYKLFRPSHS